VKVRLLVGLFFLWIDGWRVSLLITPLSIGDPKLGFKITMNGF
jgi:hypothetical protein